MQVKSKEPLNQEIAEFISKLEKVKLKTFRNDDNLEFVIEFLNQNIESKVSFEKIDNQISKEYGLDIVEKIKSLSNSYATKKSLLSPLIELGVLEREFPHQRLQGTYAAKASIDDLVKDCEKDEEIYGVIPVINKTESGQNIVFWIVGLVIMGFVTTIGKALFSTIDPTVTGVISIAVLVVIYFVTNKEKLVRSILVIGTKTFWLLDLEIIEENDQREFVLQKSVSEKYTNSDLSRNIRFEVTGNDVLKLNFTIYCEGKYKYLTINTFNNRINPTDILYKLLSEDDIVNLSRRQFDKILKN